MVSCVGVVPGVVAAILLHGFYALLRGRQNDITVGIQYVEMQNLVKYISISEFISQRNRRYFRFVMFRCIPVLVVFLPTIGHLEEYYPENQASKWVALAAFVVTNILLTFLPNKRLLPYVSVKITYWLLTLLTLSVALLVVVLSHFVSLDIFALDWADLWNNLAAALLAAILVVVYLESTNMAEKPERRHQVRSLSVVIRKNKIT